MYLLIQILFGMEIVGFINPGRGKRIRLTTRTCLI